MHPNEQLIHNFYAAFAKRDAAAMAACYHRDIAFSDPAFPMLRGKEVTAMWAMLCARGKDLEIIASGISADAEGGRGHWDAKYTFSQTGRHVHNKIDALFAFRDGKIIPTRIGRRVLIRHEALERYLNNGEKNDEK